ncbi:MAG: DNA gyrase subunit A [Eubacteriales bacterium]|nr:DNA gyrase subunit A [Eubacteriales bacterium]
MDELRKNEKLLDMNLEHEMQKSFISYAMAVIINRALPDVRDGLKPVHRRIIYDMNELGMTYDKPYKKSARIVGDVLGKYHPHGDTAVYDAMVRLAQPFSTRYMLVDGQGNFGSVDGDGAAAMRYTEARMSKLCQYLIGEIDKDTVDFIPNFDETLLQPSVLPSRFPNLLVNGSNGIAVGMATNIPPHNLGEVIDGVNMLIDNPDATLDDLMTVIKGPDFPTGGLIQGKAGIRAAYKTGRGRIVVRAKTDIEMMPGNRQRIIVTEIPYMVNKAKLIENIANHIKQKKLDGISALRDESDRRGMRIVIEIKRDANAQVVLNYLFKHTQMQETFGAIMLALVNGEPKLLSLKDMLHYYIMHQKEVVTRRTQYDLDKALARSHILEGLLIALDHIDEIVELIKKSPDTNTARDALMSTFNLSEKQAQAILDMRLARLTGLEREKLQSEYDDLQEKISYLRSILSDETKLFGIIKDEINDIKNKFNDERRSQIVPAQGDIDVIDLIKREDVVITLSNLGYVKRLPLSTYRAQNRGGKGIIAMKNRDEDYSVDMLVVSSHDELLVFTTKGRVYPLSAYEIPEAGRTGKGLAIVNLLNLDADENVTNIILLDSSANSKYLTLCTKRGTMKRSKLRLFKHIRKGGLVAITLVDDDELIGAEITDGNRSIMLGTRKGKAIHFSESDIRASGRSSQGIRAIRLEGDDYVISMAIVDENQDVLNISVNGFGKRTKLDEYKLQARGGKGLKAMNLSERNGDMAAQLLVSEDDDILILSDNGTLIRTEVSNISITGRATQGVRLMRLDDESHVVSVAIAPNEEEELESHNIDESEDIAEVDDDDIESEAFADEIDEGLDMEIDEQSEEDDSEI